MAAFTYRLQTLLDQKEELKKQAERELVALEEDLRRQIASLETLQETVQTLTEKRQQMRRDLLNPGQGATLSAQKVQERIEYTKAVGFQIEDAQAEVVTQRGVIEQCEFEVQQGKKSVQEANRE